MSSTSRHSPCHVPSRLISLACSSSCSALLCARTVSSLPASSRTRCSSSTTATFLRVNVQQSRDQQSEREDKAGCNGKERGPGGTTSQHLMPTASHETPLGVAGMPRVSLTWLPSQCVIHTRPPGCHHTHPPGCHHTRPPGCQHTRPPGCHVCLVVRSGDLQRLERPVPLRSHCKGLLAGSLAGRGMEGGTGGIRVQGLKIQLQYAAQPLFQVP